ncbi:MAG: hypothetical protein ACFFBP_23075 [Promethearchaeota archaeon]
MDAGLDFIKPEFLNILFFQQKNLVIFPYVDLKHLHALETFTVGHNIVDIESTALYNLKEIIEGETVNSYSQNPNLFLVYNLDNEKLKEILEIEGIRCILNVKENAGSLANAERFVFYNKKTKTFLNHEFNDRDIEFERHLIMMSKNPDILLDTIQKIKASATRIFKDYIEVGKLDSLPVILRDYPKKYWSKILAFVETYFDIILPKVNISRLITLNSSSSFSSGFPSFSHEYELIITQNRDVAKEFTLTLHDYQSRKVNPANLELEQLFNPQKLYDYLRNNHWKNGISKDFLEEWISMRFTDIKLTDELKDEFQKLFENLNIPLNEINELLPFKSHIKKRSIQDTEVNSSGNITNKEINFNFSELSISLSNVMTGIERVLFGNKISHQEKKFDLKISNFPLFKKKLLDIISDIYKKSII